jgi:hypothetical protein
MPGIGIRALHGHMRAKIAARQKLGPRRVERLRRRRGENLIQVPVSSIVDDYGFSLAKDGWHYFRSLVSEYEQDPAIALQDTIFFKFFQHLELHAVRYLDDVLFLHRPSLRAANGYKFYLGTYPWGDWTSSDALVGGRPFGFHYDRVENRRTRDLYGYRRNPWYQPGDTYPLRVEWHHTLALYESLKKGYRPLEHGSFPSVVLLLRSDGAIRAVRYEGHHRLCLLAHLGYEEITVALHRESIKVVDERECEDWYYVKHGLCSAEEALRIFHAFFEQDGSERLEYLGLMRAY